MPETAAITEPEAPKSHGGFLSRWFMSGRDLSIHHKETTSHQHPWFAVMWLTGVDYFSSIAYQAGIALLAAGILAPIATVVLVFVTLFCAVPVYREVARRSYAGQGSIALLENLVKGWPSKLLVLVLLGFAGTDFVITMTLSAADSAQHVVENPLVKQYAAHLHMAITIGLLAILAIVFLKGFGEAIVLAMAVAIPYILLNATVTLVCGLEILHHPEMLRNWHAALHAGGDGWTGIFIASCFVFPRLALGLSGFETGVSLMPLIRGDATDKAGRGKTGEEDQASAPKGRIRNTGRLLLAAAALMSVLLIGSSIVTTLLIPESAYREGGPASGRAMAYLAHQYLGSAFGSLYDVSTILILWFAGASAMAGLLNLIPRYLPRFGMAPRWVSYARPLVLVLFAIDLGVTFAFRGSVVRQGGAYATGVLVLIFSAAVAAALVLWRDASENKEGKVKSRIKSLYFWLCAVVFAYTLGANIKERPDGIIIASIFIALLIVTSVISRYFRSIELRVRTCGFCDEESRRLWDKLEDGNLNIVPIATLDKKYRSHIRAKVERSYKVAGPLTFLHVELLDDRSEFYEQLEVEVKCSSAENIIIVRNANVIANTIAYVSIKLKAKNIILGLAAEKSPLVQALRYVSFGTGEVGMMVYEILTNYWQERPEAERPTLFLMAG
ncbi:MAG: hypothetical protein ACRD2U_06705 [Terriglobales bacterium]